MHPTITKCHSAGPFTNQLSAYVHVDMFVAPRRMCADRQGKRQCASKCGKLWSGTKPPRCACLKLKSVNCVPALRARRLAQTACTSKLQQSLIQVAAYEFGLSDGHDNLSHQRRRKPSAKNRRCSSGNRATVSKVSRQLVPIQGEDVVVVNTNDARRRHISADTDPTGRRCSGGDYDGDTHFEIATT